uniref:Uncharacterized protein n=1 Tax=Populus trichocarpa TaxID=3694 RepID=A0A2K1X011_POPTR
MGDDLGRACSSNFILYLNHKAIVGLGLNNFDCCRKWQWQGYLTGKEAAETSTEKVLGILCRYGGRLLVVLLYNLYRQSRYTDTNIQ